MPTKEIDRFNDVVRGYDINLSEQIVSLLDKVTPDFSLFTNTFSSDNISVEDVGGYKVTSLSVSINLMAVLPHIMGKFIDPYKCGFIAPNSCFVGLLGASLKFSGNFGKGGEQPKDYWRDICNDCETTPFVMAPFLMNDLHLGEGYWVAAVDGSGRTEALQANLMNMSGIDFGVIDMIAMSQSAFRDDIVKVRDELDKRILENMSGMSSLRVEIAELDRVLAVVETGSTAEHALLDKLDELLKLNAAYKAMGFPVKLIVKVTDKSGTPVTDSSFVRDIYLSQ